MSKKLLVCVMAIASVFVLSGCEKKGNNNGGETTTTAPAANTLSCSIAVDGDTTRLSMTYEGDSITKASYSESEKKASEAEAKKDYEKNQKEAAEYNKKKGVTCNVSYSGTLSSTSINFTVASLDDDAKALYNELFKDLNTKGYDDVKNTLTTLGYTCK